MENKKNVSYEDDPLKKEVFNYLEKHPYPTDKDFHDYAKSIGEDPSNCETAAYALLSDFIDAGEAKEEGISENDVNQKELEMGIEIEYEHTVCPMIAKRIALDHLSENSSYYSWLEFMEKLMEKYKTIKNYLDSK